MHYEIKKVLMKDREVKITCIICFCKLIAKMPFKKNSAQQKWKSKIGTTKKGAYLYQ